MMLISMDEWSPLSGGPTHKKILIKWWIHGRRLQIFFNVKVWMCRVGVSLLDGCPCYEKYWSAPVISWTFRKVWQNRWLVLFPGGQIPTREILDPPLTAYISGDIRGSVLECENEHKAMPLLVPHASCRNNYCRPTNLQDGHVFSHVSSRRVPCDHYAFNLTV